MVISMKEVKMPSPRLDQSILEVRSVEEANAVDLSVYRLERFSESRNCYIFVKRVR